MKRRYQLGICEWAFPLTGPAGIRMMPHYGVELVQLDLGPYELGLPLSVPEIQEAYRQAAKASGVKLHSIGCSDLGLYGMTNPPESEKGAIAREIIQKGIDTAAAMHVPMVMVTNFRDGLITGDEGYQNTAGCIRWACQEAAKHGITLVSESAMSSAQILRLADELKADNFGICLDTQNPWLRWGYYVPDMIRELRELIAFIHVKDGADGQISSRLLGDGDSSFFESVEAIREIGYEGAVILENLYNKKPLSQLGNGPFALLRQDVERFHRAFD